MATTPKKYAEGTTVSISHSWDEIKRNLKRHGATGFFQGEQGDRAAIVFELKGRRYRMELQYPSLSAFSNLAENQYTARMSKVERAEKAWEQEKARLWRGLALLVKGKLEAVASGIATLEEELLSYTVLPNQQTVSQWLQPQLEEAYEQNTLPPLLPGSASHQKMIDAPNGYREGQIR